MKIVLIGSGMMGSAMSVPALDNGHSVVLVGTPLDTEIIDGLKESGYHKTLKRELKGDISFKQFEEIKDNIPNFFNSLLSIQSPIHYNYKLLRSFFPPYYLSIFSFQ